MRRLPALWRCCLAACLLTAGCDLSLRDFDPLDDAPEPFSREALNFLVVGDWGRKGWLLQDDVARVMGPVADSTACRFVISTGDNFYENGVQGLDDPHWQRSFERVYSARSLQVPWYVVLGNHDYYGSVRAQIQYTERSDRWKLPARYYAVEHEVDDTTRALFVFLDTVTLVGGEAASTEDFSRPELDPERQLRWLDSTLAVSTAAWRLVVGHHAIYSASAKRRDPAALRSRLAPILRRHRVAAYLAGHEHNLQHLSPGDGVHYFISGSGSIANPVSPDSTAEFAAGVSGFMAASLTPDQLHVQFISYKGRVGYATSIPLPARERAPALELPEAIPAP